MNNIRFLNTLQTGSLYLYLGQNYLESYLGNDALLDAIQKNFYNDQTDSQKYELLKSINPKIDISNTLLWIKQKSDRIATPDQLECIAKLPWNGVITSSFDTIVSRAFNNNWRDAFELTSYRPQSTEIFTSKTKLNISMLFGSVNQDPEGEYPPFDNIEFSVALNRAQKLIARYSPDVISPYGIIVIDGYNPEKDWLKPEYLYPVFSKLAKEQIHYFGVKRPITDEFLLKLIEDGIIITHVENLCEFLMDASSKGMIDLENIDHGNIGLQKRIMINHRSVLIPKAMYNLISEDVIVLDDLIMLPKEEIKKKELLDVFREFLYHSNTKPYWDGYKQKLNLRRTYEKELFESIRSELSKDYDLLPIILHGQSGSSKSVTLGQIAYDLKMEGIYPVIYIPKMQNEINMNNINNFCKWCEDNEADKVIIFWDASFSKGDIGKCVDLNNYLVSKGRKVLTVCTAYKILNERHYDVKYIKSSPILDINEKNELLDIFKKTNDKYEILERLLLNDADNILLILYRLLPASRKNIRTGIVREAQITETTLKQLLKISECEEFFSSMELAFLNAGVTVPEIESQPEDYGSDFQNIINIVCIPGQFNLRIPLELVFRTLDLPYKVNVAKFIDEIDFLVVAQNSSGIWELGTRNYVEAEIVIKSHLSSLDQQVTLILKMIENVKSCEFYEAKSELDFIIELLKKIGPNGESSSYSDFYNKIYDKLRQIRIENGISNTRTVLQESSYLREHFKQNSSDYESSNIVELNDAADLLRGEIERLNNRNKDSEVQIKGYLMVELA